MPTAAALVLFVVAAVHTIGGELVVFRSLARWKDVPQLFGSDTFWKGTLRATWHAATCLGVAVAIVLLHEPDRFVTRAIAASLAVAAIVVAAFTRGRHPGWAGFLVAAILCVYS